MKIEIYTPFKMAHIDRYSMLYNYSILEPFMIQ